MKPTENHNLSPNQVAKAIRLMRHTLDSDANNLPYNVSERLRAARMQTLSQMKNNTPITHEKPVGNGSYNWLKRMPTLTKILMTVPALCLAIVIAQNTHSLVTKPSNLTNAQATNSYSPTAIDTANALNIDAILKEQIPLQAYLNKDFNQFIDQDKTQNVPQKASSPQSTGMRHVQKNTIIQALR